MPRSPFRLLALLVALLITAQLRAGLNEDVELLVRTANLPAADIAVSVREAGAGKRVVMIDDDRLMIPASNMKLITSGAALHALGPQFRFVTQFMYDGSRLTLVGDGDPALADPELLKLMAVGDTQGLDVDTFLSIWIEAAKKAGITHVDSVVVDDRIFDRQYVHPTWPLDQLNRRYCAEVAGANFHLNVLHFYPSPVPDQRPDLTEFHPHANWIDYQNKATSRLGRDDNDDVWIARRHGTNQLTFYGNVKRPFVTAVPVTIHNPPEFLAKLLADRLRKAGITVDEAVTADAATPPAGGTLIEPAITTPLATAITRCNRDSQNLYAECLLKRIGHARTGQPGSWTNGSAIIRLILHERLENHLLASNANIADGSGLSRKNRIAPSTMTAWLNSFHNDPTLGEPFVESMASANERTGTLAKRFRNVKLHGAEVRAKTGYINAVSCLSGYVTMPDGRRMCFSIMGNDLAKPQSVRRAKQLQERIVAQIAEHMAMTESRVLGGE